MAKTTQVAFDELQADAAKTEELIVVTQLPVIEERLREVKEKVELAVTEAKGMVATGDTV
ncbi:MAG: hypothetical protein IJV40_06050 [Oscillospiraceae bacterium]|nr:hypothetical protein [Oscillospiraceae bacterium]